MKRGLGTQLRHLPELLDGAASAACEAEGLAYKNAMASESAAWTIALMIKDELVRSERGPQGGRQRVIRLTDHGRALNPRLQARSQATAETAATLGADLPMPLTQLLDEALQALERQSFGKRIQTARAAAETTATLPGKTKFK